MNRARPILDRDGEIVTRAKLDSIYVMWSEDRQLSKIGLSFAPHARANQLRRQRNDDTIKLASCWNILSCGEFIGPAELELNIHESLRAAGLQDPANPFPNEWFTLRWPAAIEFVEQVSQLWSVLGVRLQRMPGNHGR